MAEQTTLKESISSLEETFLNWAETHDVKYVTEDAVFKNLGTGEEYKGREAIGGMLHFMYHVAFDARAEVTNYIVTEDKAMLEGFFIGKHIGELAGVPATNKDVRVPLCVSYDLKNGLIREGRIYMLSSVMMQQLQS